MLGWCIALGSAPADPTGTSSRKCTAEEALPSHGSLGAKERPGENGLQCPLPGHLSEAQFSSVNLPLEGSYRRSLLFSMGCF